MPGRRLELENQEKELISKIDNQSEELEKKTKKVIKTSLIIGASVLASYLIYSVLSSDTNPAKKRENYRRKTNIFRNSLAKNILESALKKGIKIIIGDKSKEK